MTKPTYEELERRFQSYCKHDGGTRYTPGTTGDICAIYGWDRTKCQHRNESGKFCSQCGELLKPQGGAS
jgi:hypothetical protein